MSRAPGPPGARRSPGKLPLRAFGAWGVAASSVGRGVSGAAAAQPQRLSGRPGGAAVLCAGRWSLRSTCTAPKRHHHTDESKQRSTCAATSPFPQAQETSRIARSMGSREAGPAVAAVASAPTVRGIHLE